MTLYKILFMKIDIFLGILVYFILWWLLLFITLPLRYKNNKKKNYFFKRKNKIYNYKNTFFITTMISLVLWFILGILLKFYAPKYGFFYKNIY